MNTPKQGLKQEYKICAGKGCSSLGVYYLKVIYLERSGWFCSSCRNCLVADGLISEDAPD